MKEKLVKQYIFYIFFFVLGIVATYVYTRVEINSNKELTVRILRNAITSMETSQSLATSCSEAYVTATTCVANLSTCNIQEQSKRLDIFNNQRKDADTKIENANQELKAIVEEVKNNR